VARRTADTTGLRSYDLRTDDAIAIEEMLKLTPADNQSDK